MEELVSWSLTSLFSTNMTISETTWMEERDGAIEESDEVTSYDKAENVIFVPFVITMLPVLDGEQRL